MKTLLLKVSVSVALLYVLLARADVGDLARRLASAGWLPVAACSLCIFFLSVTTAARWRIVLAEFQHPLAFASVWRYTAVGMFFNQLLPSGMGGDGLRMWYAQRAGLPLGLAVGTVVVDRVLGLLGLLLLVAMGTPYLLSLGVPGILARVISISAVLLGSVIAAFLFVDHILAAAAGLLRRAPPPAFLRRPFFSRMKGMLERTAKDTRLLLASLPGGPLAIVLSLLNHIALGLVVLYLASSMSLGLSPAAALFLFPLVLLLSMMPVSLAGWGIREGAMVLIFSLAGLSADAALSLSVLFGACMFLSGLPGGLIWLLARREVISR